MSDDGRLRVIPSVFVAVIKDGKVLLLRRYNTGWIDGSFDLPAGHLENQEKLRAGAIRELKEETGLEADPKDLFLIHVYQNHHNPEAPHYGYIFATKKWSGTPKITEPNKCNEMDFFPLNNLPKETAPYIKKALENLSSGQVSDSYWLPGSIPGV
jgi:ADP-ribose pyrophosphatase YjhB (NUDIX family)